MRTFSLFSLLNLCWFSSHSMPWKNIIILFLSAEHRVQSWYTVTAYSQHENIISDEKRKFNFPISGCLSIALSADLSVRPSVCFQSVIIPLNIKVEFQSCISICSVTLCREILPIFPIEVGKIWKSTDTRIRTLFSSLKFKSNRGEIVIICLGVPSTAYPTVTVCLSLKTGKCRRMRTSRFDSIMRWKLYTRKRNCLISNYLESDCEMMEAGRADKMEKRKYIPSI